MWHMVAILAELERSLIQGGSVMRANKPLEPWGERMPPRPWVIRTG